MPYIFIDDGYPDATDYENNYIFFDESDLDQMEDILEAINQRIESGHSRYSNAKDEIQRSINKKKQSMTTNQTSRLIQNKGMIRGLLWLLNRCLHPSAG